jgi:hypothetical protein
MDKNYKRLKNRWEILLVLIGLLLSGPLVWAQSGPVGNEWIVPGQQYYKVKVVKDGLYKLDYQYLTQAGISGVAPSRLQIWRRGQELTRYVGGNTTVLDPTTFIEFYAVHNDGKLDGELYKLPQDQPHQLFNFYTDTAAYFITWSTAANRLGRDMPQPAAAGGTVHQNRIMSPLYLHSRDVKDRNYGPQNTLFLPWVEPGEGYFWIITSNYTTDSPTNGIPQPLFDAADSTMRSVSPQGANPTVEVGVFGVTDVAHRTEVLVVPPTGPERILGVIRYQGFARGQSTFPILRSDIHTTGSRAGRVVVRVRTLAPAIPGDFFALTFVRVKAPQASRWFANRNSIAFLNDSTLSGPATYELDSIPATVAGFDVQDFNNVQRIVGTTVSGTRRRFVFPGATANSTHQLLLADENYLRVPPLRAQRVYFRQINPVTPNFIIITHPQLMRPAAGTTNAAKSYASYRANPGPGGTRYDTLMLTTFQVYDQFSYGDRSWLAMRHFGRWLAAATTPANANRYLLLLGKGVVMSEVYNGGYFRFNGEQGLDLVPTSPRSVSDNMLTADFANNNYVAKLHTGRLTATTPQQVMNYLNKLRTHESLAPAPWRKNILHLVGGYTPSEITSFLDYMNTAKVRAERPYLGGRVSTEYRVTPNSLPVSIDISAQLNAGLSLISYLGHGTSTALGLNFGQPSTALNYTNTGKYPALFVNGCAINSTFTTAPTIVEDWLFADQKGALGSLGETGFSYPDPLGIAQDTLYKILFNEPAWFGKPITVANDEAVRRLQGTPYFSDDAGIEQLLTKNWQGDPAFALFAPAQPDFVASNSALSITPANGQPSVRADSPNFTLNVGVSNPGRITYDPVVIQVTRVFPAASGRANQVYPLFTFRQSWRTDTTYALTLPNIVGASGTSTFRVVIDPNNQVAELNETNNSAQIDFTFLQGGVTILRPTEFAIVTGTTPQLVVQSNDPLGASRVYEFELDTVATFNSGQIRRQAVTSGVVAQWAPTLPAVLGRRDSIVWYWRARFQTPTADEDGTWVTSSFRVIPSSPGGWSQSHYAQFKRDTRTGVEVSAPAGHWDFVNTRVPLVLRTRGGGVPRSQPNFSTLIGAGIYIQSAAGLPSVSGCGVQSPNLLIAVYNGASLRPITMPTTYQRCGQSPDFFYYFSTTDPANPANRDTLDNLNYSVTRQQQLDAFLSAIPNGAYVAVVSANRLRYSLLPAALKNRLQTLLGSQLVNTLADGEPLALVGQKLTATTGRLVHERGPDRTVTVPGYNQGVELRDTLQRPSAAGRIVSTRIGPSQQWLNLYRTIQMPTVAGRHTLSVVAIDTLGQETVILPNVTTAVQPLTAQISAQRYPYIRLELAVSDTVTRIPPQLRQWLVTSRGLPEGIVRRDSVPAAVYAPAALAQKVIDTGYLDFPVKFQNVSDEAFIGPLQTRINVRDVSRTGSPIIATQLISSPALAPGRTLTVQAHVDLRLKYGTFATEVVVNPRLQPEQNYSNNELKLTAFTIVNNNMPPTLDVAFDGRHILNGELVSPRPVINIQLSDEDKVNHITDVSAFTVTLSKHGQSGIATPVVLTGPGVSFSVDATNGSVAKLLYEPGKTAPLADGMYELRVQGRDPSNATAGAQEFQVKFEVVNASQISNVYPYPNPVVSKARFVFTLTGQELPRNMKIQIMSLTGRVVREIFMSELGPLHIGNNITDFAWDGTDSYGDRLANGTYLYRVAMDDPNSAFGHRDTAGDRAFKNDWGKLVLMR